MVILRSTARELGLLRYFTGKSCPQGHVCERIVSNGGCIICLRDAVKRAKRSGGPRRVKESARVRKALRLKKKAGGRCREAEVKRKKKYKLENNLRTRLRTALKDGAKVGSVIRDLGCSIVEFKTYIAAKFQDGMSWDNHGEWHLDHIKPLASFNLTDRTQFLQAFHYTNYQPLWAAENLKKGAKHATV